MVSEKYKYFTEEQLNQKGYNFRLMLYPVSDNYNAGNILNYIELLSVSGDIKQYAYIYHDKDGNEPHWHICVKFKDQIRVKTFLNKFGLEYYNPNENDIIIHKDKWLYALNYLIHNTPNSKSEYQYSEDEVISNIPGTINNLRNSQDSSDIFLDICDFITNSYAPPKYKEVLAYCRSKGNHYIKSFMNRGNNYIFSSLIKERIVGY